MSFYGNLQIGKSLKQTLNHMDNAKAQLAEKLKASTNILVTVSRNPSVDQLAACIGLTLLLNKQGKHAAAVFSGTVPSTLEFLQPEETLERNTNSLRDFIISLDKSKADKLRYKVEDNVVRIFITPYKTSISEADLEFTQGDFNVDLVVALGVHLQEELDEAITAHGRILHDATVASINTSTAGSLGTMNWVDPQASSLSELVTELAELNGKDLIDNQIATALLTGIVAETDRFSNEKTTSQTMAASATLMAAGANQQLVASKLQEGLDISASVQAGPGIAGKTDQSVADGIGSDGVMAIDHREPSVDDSLPPLELPKPTDSEFMPEAKGDSAGTAEGLSSGSRLVTEPPSLGGMLTANTQAEGLDPTTDPFSLPASNPPQLLDHAKPAASPAPPAQQTPLEPPAAFAQVPFTPSPAPPTAMPPSTEPFTSGVPADSSASLQPMPPESAWTPAAPEPDAGGRTLADLEASVGSSHVAASKSADDAGTRSGDVDAARDEVSKALNSDAAAAAPEPIKALNAQPLGTDLHPEGETVAPASPIVEPSALSATTPTASIAPVTMSPIPPTTSLQTPAAPQIPSLEISEDGTLTQTPVTVSPTNPPAAGAAPAAFEPVDPNAPQVIDPTAPPPVPPPIPFQFGGSSSNQHPAS